MLELLELFAHTNLLLHSTHLQISIQQTKGCLMAYLIANAVAYIELPPCHPPKDAEVDVRAGDGEPPVQRGGAAGAQLVPVARLHAAPLQGVPQLAAAATGPAGLGPVAHDGTHRLRGRHAGLPLASGIVSFSALTLLSG